MTHACPSILRQICLDADHQKDKPYTASFQYDDNNFPQTLDHLGRLNAFIGPNNSGKSRLLRHLFLDKNIEALSVRDIKSLREYQAVIESLIGKINNQNYKNTFDTGFFSKLAHRNKQINELLQTGRGQLVRLRSENTNILQNGLDQNILDLINLVDNTISEKGKLKNLNLLRLYLPAIRTLRRVPIPSKYLPERKVGEIELDPLLESICIQYFSALKKAYVGAEMTYEHLSVKKERLNGDQRQLVMTGVELHSLVRELRLGTHHQRDLLESYENKISEKFFSGMPFELIPKSLPTESLHISIGDQEDRTIELIGEGVHQLILLTLPLFLFGQFDLMMFVEEPELYLHPGYQRAIIEAWLDPEFVPERFRRDSNGTLGNNQIFVATHSNQFLELTLDHLDISVFRLKRSDSTNSKDTRVSIQRMSTGDRILLEELGIKNASVMLTNATIWVEGISERVYFRKFFEVLQKDYDPKYIVREDIHYSFVEYSGGNITHYGFLDNESGIATDTLCGGLILIADDDGMRTGKSCEKKTRYETLEKNLKERFIWLECNEIENLLSPKVLVKWISEHKGNSTLDLNSIKYDDYRNEKIGEWLRTTGGENLTGLTGTIGSLKIKTKKDFANDASSYINSKGDLTDYAITISKKILEFVRKKSDIPNPPE